MAATTNEWEYCTVAVKGDIAGGCTTMGKDRWEAVCPLAQDESLGTTFLFKRPVLLVQIASDLPRRPPLIGS